MDILAYGILHDVTTHFINKDWELKEAVLSTASTEERHTAVNISNHLLKVAADYRIKDKVSGYVHDNAGNQALAKSMLEEERDWTSIGCAAHTLQLAVNGGLDDAPAIQNALASARRLVTHFKKPTVAINYLHKRQRPAGREEHQLISDCATRWNSSLYRLERLVEEKLCAEGTLQDNDRADLNLRGAQWDLIKELCKVLHVLDVATTTGGVQQAGVTVCCSPSGATPG